MDTEPQSGDLLLEMSSLGYEVVELPQELALARRFQLQRRINIMGRKSTRIIYEEELSHPQSLVQGFDSLFNGMLVRMLAEAKQDWKSRQNDLGTALW